MYCLNQIDPAGWNNHNNTKMNKIKEQNLRQHKQVIRPGAPNGWAHPAPYTKPIMKFLISKASWGKGDSQGDIKTCCQKPVEIW